jgi:hypothetical protein
VKRPSPAQLKKACVAFNLRHQVGDEITVYTGRVGENPKVGKIMFPAEVLSGHTPVVWVEGVRGCVALSHTAATPALKNPPKPPRARERPAKAEISEIPF